MRRTHTSFLFLAFSSCALAAMPSKPEVLQAISVLERNITSPEAIDAAKTVVDYAQESDDVMVDIGPEQVPWVGEKWGLDQEREMACQSMLFAAFVAGNVKSQIGSERAQNDTFSGWVFAIKAYERLRAKGSFQSPAIESLSKMQADGTLRQHAKDIELKEEQDDKADSDRKPFA